MSLRKPEWKSGISSILRDIFDNTFEHSAVEKGYIFWLLVLYKNFL